MIATLFEGNQPACRYAIKLSLQIFMNIYSGESYLKAQHAWMVQLLSQKIGHNLIFCNSIQGFWKESKFQMKL